MEAMYPNVIYVPQVPIVYQFQSYYLADYKFIDTPFALDMIFIYENCQKPSNRCKLFAFRTWHRSVSHNKYQSLFLQSIPVALSPDLTDPLSCEN